MLGWPSNSIFSRSCAEKPRVLWLFSGSLLLPCPRKRAKYGFRGTCFPDPTLSTPYATIMVKTLRGRCCVTCESSRGGVTQNSVVIARARGLSIGVTLSEGPSILSLLSLGRRLLVPTQWKAVRREFTKGTNRRGHTAAAVLEAVAVERRTLYWESIVMVCLAEKEGSSCSLLCVTVTRTTVARGLRRVSSARVMTRDNRPMTRKIPLEIAFRTPGLVAGSLHITCRQGTVR